jgi:hypothetical protein
VSGKDRICFCSPHDSTRAKKVLLLFGIESAKHKSSSIHIAAMLLPTTGIPM